MVKSTTSSNTSRRTNDSSSMKASNMPLYYITGIAGSGKSTVLSELKRRGYEAYDVDEAGPATAKWYNDTTGFVHPKSSVKKEDRTPDFLANHSWKVPRQEVVELA